MVESIISGSAGFVTCGHCQSLVAVDAITGAAPEHCPYCDGAIAVVVEDTNPEPDAEPDAVLKADVDPDIDADADTRQVTSMDNDRSAPGVLHDASGLQASADDGDQAAGARSATGADTRGDTGTTPASPQKRPKTAHPSFARRTVAGERSTHDARWPWPVAASLMLLLLLQLILADRASLAAQPRWRATITNICSVLRCEIPPWREAGAFTMLARDVHAHPGIADALRIRAAFRNDAHWPQPWPQLVLTLSDASGRVTGSRTFTADEYLGDAPTQKLIGTGQTAAVALEIEEPASDTVSFSFDFR